MERFENVMTVSYRWVRILLTNDDGVHAPGLAAITEALSKWARDATQGDHELVVVAPLANHSGASAAVGTVYERETIAYRAVHIPGAEDVDAFGVDAPPALATIVAVLGAFGPKPDLIVSGVNLGANVGRSVLHSGTVGAVLAGAQLGVRGLAVSLRSGMDPTPWETATATAVAVLPSLFEAPTPTVLNLNVPALPLGELRGIRRGRIGSSGIIKAAWSADGDDGALGSLGRQARHGEIRLDLGAAVPSLGRTSGEDPDDDAALVAAGYASLTPIVGTHEDTSAQSSRLVERAIDAAARALATP